MGMTPAFASVVAPVGDAALWQGLSPWLRSMLLGLVHDMATDQVDERNLAGVCRDQCDFSMLGWDELSAPEQSLISAFVQILREDLASAEGLGRRLH